MKKFKNTASAQLWLQSACAIDLDVRRYPDCVVLAQLKLFPISLLNVEEMVLAGGLYPAT